MSQGPDGDQIPAVTIKRLSWEVVEVLGAGFLASVITISVFSTVSGVAYGFSSLQQPSTAFGGSLLGPSIAEIVQHSTFWATPWLALIVLAALGAAWWQVEGWESYIADQDQPSPSEQDYGAAFRHLLRAQSITSYAIVVLVLFSAAVPALIVSTAVIYAGQPSNFVVSEDLAVLGEGIGTLILVGIGIVAGNRLRGSVRAVFNNVGDDFEQEEDVNSA